DWVRSATVCEPRGHEALVGALLCEPVNENCVTGVIFFNNVGLLHGCLHGTMGVAVTLFHLGRIGQGTHRFDTPTGVIIVSLGSDLSTVSVGNVKSYRSRKDVEISVPGFGSVRGDVAWGGNWFFLTDAPRGMLVHTSFREELTEFARRVRNELGGLRITGDDGEEIDHIEISGPPADSRKADEKNFILCPGMEYDRSPCGTGTSAKLACLAADGRLLPGDVWRQAGILDTVFEGTIEMAPSSEGGVFPTVTGQAYITAEMNLLIDPKALFTYGIPPFTDTVNSTGEPLKLA
ncbi:UNVERIFIED_CONTAM: hypothetical protein GTU68_025121, partial [Idotea baltica]|nr:hypothetical protein [Idotea baltica]